MDQQAQALKGPNGQPRASQACQHSPCHVTSRTPSFPQGGWAGQTTTVLRPTSEQQSLHRSKFEFLSEHVGTALFLVSPQATARKSARLKQACFYLFDTERYSSCSQQSLKLLRELKQQQASVRNTQQPLTKAPQPPWENEEATS